MKKESLLLALALLASAATGTDSSKLAEQMKRLGVRSALVVASQAVDGSPTWSPTGEAIAANIEGQWKSVDLRDTKLVKGTWHRNDPIGVIESPSLTSVSEAYVRDWRKAGIAGQREVVAKDGTKTQLLSEELGTRLVITKRGAMPETLWATSLENCHGLSLSPDEQQIGYVCELNGVIITNLAE